MAVTNAQLAALETLTPANMLNAWIQAEAAVALAGQSYQIGDRKLTRADLPEIRKSIQFWQGQVAAASGADSGAGGGNALVQFGEAQ